jgi:hypothetical protein
VTRSRVLFEEGAPPLSIRPLLEAPASADGETAAPFSFQFFYSRASKGSQITLSYRLLQTRFPEPFSKDEFRQ